MDFLPGIRNLRSDQYPKYTNATDNSASVRLWNNMTTTPIKRIRMAQPRSRDATIIPTLLELSNRQQLSSILTIAKEIIKTRLVNGLDDNAAAYDAPFAVAVHASQLGSCFSHRRHRRLHRLSKSHKFHTLRFSSTSAK
jgi:hypothetical protein